MSNEKRPHDFAARLQRIEELNRQPKAALPPQVRKDLTYDGSGMPEDNRLRNAIIWLVICAGMGTGGYFAAQAVPPELSASVIGISSALSGARADDNPVLFDPDDSFGADGRGANLQSPAVLAALPEPLTLTEVVTGHMLPDATTQIGRIIPFDRNSQCNLRRPQDGEQVVNIRLENGALPAPVRAFSDTALVSLLTQTVAAATQGGAPYDAAARVTGDLTSVDVFVTDTEAPVYLVLQNMGRGIIWNVQTAPDVTLAHVAIVSSGWSGLVSPPADTTFEALLVGDFVPPHASGADDRVRSCMIRPWRAPQDDWVSVQRAGRDSLAADEVASFTKGYTAYDAWFTGTLGIDAATNLIAAQSAAHVLAGPRPKTPFAYRGMAGRDVHLMRTDHMFSGDPATVQTAIDALHSELLRAAIGDDLSRLDPAAIERPRP
jgi:hypothetical protein